jgi:hypothetical protein
MMRSRSTLSPWRFPFTATALALAGIVLIAALFWRINLIELPFRLMDRIEAREVDDVVTAFLLVIVGVVIDQVVTVRRERRTADLEIERLRVVQVTMRTVQDVINNCLNQLQLVRFEAEGFVSPDSLAMFDGAIRDAAAQLKKLADLEAYVEHDMAIGTGLGPAEDVTAQM